MDEITAADLEMILRGSRRPRDHTRNLEIVKGIFDKEHAYWLGTLTFLATAALGAVGTFAAALLKGEIAPIRQPIQAAQVVALVILYSTLVLALVLVMGRVRAVTRAYLGLIRTYYFLDRRVRYRA